MRKVGMFCSRSVSYQEQPGMVPDRIRYNQFATQKDRRPGTDCREVDTNKLQLDHSTPQCVFGRPHGPCRTENIALLFVFGRGAE